MCMFCVDCPSGGSSVAAAEAAAAAGAGAGSVTWLSWALASYSAVAARLFSPVELAFRAQVWLVEWLYAATFNWVVVGWLFRVARWFLTSKWVLAFIWSNLMMRAWLITGRMFDAIFPPMNPLWLYFLPFRFIRFVARDILFRLVRFFVRQLLRAVSWVRRAITLALQTARFTYGKILDVLARLCRRLGTLFPADFG